MKTQLLTQNYEELREAVLRGSLRRQVGLGVMLNQGMWAWIALVSAGKTPLRMEPLSEPRPEFSLAPRIESLASHPTLLGVLTDLLLGQLTAQEAI